MRKGEGESPEALLARDGEAVEPNPQPLPWHQRRVRKLAARGSAQGDAQICGHAFCGHVSIRSRSIVVPTVIAKERTFLSCCPCGRKGVRFHEVQGLEESWSKLFQEIQPTFHVLCLRFRPA